MPIRNVRKISFVASFFICDEEVTIRKRKSVLGHFAATEACIRPCVHFPRSSEMSICSSLIALMALSFSPPLMKIVCFCSTGFTQCRCNKLQGCPCLPIIIFLYSLSTFMSACRSILCPIVVFASFWHTNVFTLFSLYMSNTMCICETD